MTCPPGDCVIDASVAICLVLREPLADQARALMASLYQDDRLTYFTSILFDLECGNALWKAARNGRSDRTAALHGMTYVIELPVQRLEADDLAATALDLALELGITVYDASYVAVARELDVPLVTADERLASALDGSEHRVVRLREIDV